MEYGWTDDSSTAKTDNKNGITERTNQKPKKKCYWCEGKYEVQNHQHTQTKSKH